ncbi:BTAD domain-containing putative transcriptional regulator [Streptomyces sp. ISL-100]|uniref:BTAD domain-containing putative transcriptional regulator n=1 Tax=Streptomyces sp. ISL-100 TaxID=2819173 RepID=UPI001BE557E7|nr:BTAD domain-containing putative transcriptional regulator [Streptomyces sp. ISL-100]MBT2398026.1 tetratricopeptide repeat protein [Streptomyces sp. ISL-100]
MRFAILGPLDIRSADGDALDPGGPRPRALLTLLVLEAGRAVGTEQLTDGLYGDEPPAGAANALQSQVSRLRRRLGVTIESLPAGYRLVADPDDVDAHRFERLSRAGHRALAEGDPSRAAELLREALGLWRGAALADLTGVPFAEARAAGLDELRLAALQDRVDANLALGGGPELVPELRELIAVHPLRERLYGQLMRALHAGGRPAEALAVYEQARRRLADELGADPSAELAALHLELLRGQSAERAAAPRGVPSQLTSFVGRGEELERIGRLLGAERLVTLTGPGGAGKTRLAVEAAGRWAGTVCYVELAPLSDEAQLPYAVLTALGVRESGFQGTAAGDAAQRLLAALEGRELLLLLDNCEHVVEGAARLAGLVLGACPRVRVLATGREALGITGEVVCPLPPLALSAAVALFADRAAAVNAVLPPLGVRPGFGAETPENDAHARVERICAALDGLPLAIELAAARLRTLTLDEIAARLDDRFRLLSRGGDRTKAPRHRTLRAVVEWSWELLDDEERLLARRLTVFAGGATLDAVERVCDVPGAEDVLASLAEKSFVEVAGGRYRMLETIRVFCAERLAGEPGQESALRAAHAAYFLELAETAEPFMRGGAQLEWLERLDADHANLLAALRPLPRHGDTAAALRLRLRLRLRLLAAISWYARLRGRQGELVPVAAELLAAVGAEPPEGLVEEYVLCVFNAVAGRGDPGDDGLIERADALMTGLAEPLRLPFTLVLWSLVSGPRSSDIEWARGRLGDGLWAGAVLDMGHGFQEMLAGRPAASEAAFGAALEGFRAAGDRWGMANSLDPLAMFAHWRGGAGRALVLLDEALALVQELEAPEETADLLVRRAAVLLHTGRPDDAVGLYTRAAELARSVGVPDKAAGAVRGLGDAARLAGDTAGAREHYEAALALVAATWFSVGETLRIFVGLGRTAGAEGRVDEAADWFGQARELALEQPGSRLDLAEVAEAMASLAAAEEAAGLLGAAQGLRGAALALDPDVARVRDRAGAGLPPGTYEKAYAHGRELRGGLRSLSPTRPSP